MADAAPQCRLCSIPLPPPSPDGLSTCTRCHNVFNLRRAPRRAIKPDPHADTNPDSIVSLVAEGSTARDSTEEDTVDAAFGPFVGAQVQSLPPGRASPFSAWFLGQYVPIGLLGKGAMGTVYLMRQAKLDRLVAVKVVREDVLSPDEARRLETEAKVLAKVNHENILGVYDVGTDSGRPYMVCEYVEGETLSARLKRKPQLTLAQSLRIVVQLLEGIRAAHKKGVIHRDLKPGNILISSSGRPKIGDFGLAKSCSVSSGTLIGKIVGTPPYMSPEQCRGGQTTMSSDLYSIGCILFEMAAGRRPFVGPETLDYLSQHTMESPPKIREINPQVPAVVEEILLKALAKDPARRYESASKFRNALIDLLRALSVSSDQPAATPTPPAFGARKPGAIEEGQVLAARYKVARLLGEGGMGQVWLAADEAMDGTEVALKVLPYELWRDNEARETLKQEAKLSQKLAHPHIVRLMTLEPGEPPFLVMEYIAGPTLAAELATRKRKSIGPYAPHEALPVIEGIASGLDHAHSKNLIHRDLKPSNVMLDAAPDGSYVAKLADFGIAAELTNYRTRQTGAVPAGTLAYMSPEQLACQKLDARADVYSLGATLYQMLTLSPPFVGGDIAWAIRNEPVPTPENVPGTVAAVLLAALAKQPDARPATAGELARRLRAAVDLLGDARPSVGTTSIDFRREDLLDELRDDPGRDAQRTTLPDSGAPGRREAPRRPGPQPWCIEAYALSFASAFAFLAVWFNIGYLMEQRLSLARVALQLALVLPLIVAPAVALWRGSERARRGLLAAHGAWSALAIALWLLGHVTLAFIDAALASAGIWLLLRPEARAYCGMRVEGLDLRAHHRRGWVLALFPLLTPFVVHALDSHAKVLAPDLVPASSWHQSASALGAAVQPADRSFSVRPPLGWVPRVAGSAAVGYLYANASGAPIAALSVSAEPITTHEGADMGRAVERLRWRRKRFYADIERAGLVTLGRAAWGECSGRFTTAGGARAIRFLETVRNGVRYEVEFYGLPAFVQANQGLLASVVASLEPAPRALKVNR